MNTTVGTISYLVEIDTSSMKGQLRTLDKAVDETSNNIASSTQKGEGGFYKMGAAMGVVAGIAQSVVTKAIDSISTSIGSAVTRVDTLENFPRVLKAMGTGSEEAKAATDRLSKSLEGLPTSLQDGAMGVQQFVAAGLSADKATSTFLAMNDALLASGGNAQDAGIVMDSLTRALSGGSTNATTMQAALSRMPTALQGLQKATGLSADELYRLYAANPQKLADDLIALDKNGGGGLSSLAEQAKEATAGISTGMTNAETAVTRGVASIITAIGSENIANAITSIGKAFETSLKGVTGFINFLKSNQEALTVFTGAITGLAVAIAVALAPAIWGAVVAFGALALAAAPFIIAGAAIGAVAYVIMSNWSGISSFFTGIWDGIKAGLQAVGDFFTVVWATIQSTVSGVINWISTNWPLLLAIITGPIGVAVLVVTRNWDTIKNAAAAAFDFIKSLPGKIVSAIGNLGSLLYNAGRDLIQGLINGIASLAGVIGNKVKEIANGAIKMFKNVLGIHSPSTVFTGFGKNITQGLVNGITSGMGSVNSAVEGITGATISPVVSTSNPSPLENLAIDSNQTVTVVHKLDGNLMIARSASDMRDVFSQGIELVNQERRARGAVQI